MISPGTRWIGSPSTCSGKPTSTGPWNTMHQSVPPAIDVERAGIGIGGDRRHRQAGDVESQFLLIAAGVDRGESVSRQRGPLGVVADV